MGLEKRPARGIAPEVWAEDTSAVSKHLWIVPELAYHNNWNWQIKVYSKLAKEIEILAISNGKPITQEHIIASYRYNELIGKHSKATINNDAQKGFEIIVENIKWLQKQQEK